MMKRHRAAHFDPEAFDAFEAAFDQILAIHRSYRDND